MIFHIFWEVRVTINAMPRGRGERPESRKRDSMGDEAIKKGERNA